MSTILRFVLTASFLVYARADCAKLSATGSNLLQATSRVSADRKTGGSVEQVEAFLPICDAAIVAQTCSDLSDGIEENAAGFVSKSVLEKELATNATAISQLLQALELNHESIDETEAVACSDLCDAAKAYLGRVTKLPSSSDRACYVMLDGSVNCSLDVSPAALAAVSNVQGDLPTANATQQLLASLMQKGDDNRGASNETRQLFSEIQKNSQAFYSAYELVERVASFFRFYPIPDPSGVSGVSVSMLATGASTKSVSCSDAVNALNAKAKVWVSSVITKVTKQEAAPLMQHWFGRTDDSTRSAVTAILNQVDQLLGSVIYKLDGDDCKNGIWAYVYQRSAKCCEDGHKVVTLCEPFCQVSEQEQLETLFHEVSHHGEAFLEDLVYGRSSCEAAAKNYPDQAITNADNFGYYVSDVASGVVYTTTTTTTAATTTSTTGACEDNPSFNINNLNCEGWSGTAECNEAKAKASRRRYVGGRLQEDCPVTCGVCSLTATKTTTTSTTTTTTSTAIACIGSCCDNADFVSQGKTCKQWAPSPLCNALAVSSRRRWAGGDLRDNCPATCGGCASSTTTTSTASGCVDNANFVSKGKTCRQWAQSRLCNTLAVSSRRRWAGGDLRDNCPATCGGC